MFLHIGNGETVREKDIIGIFDMDTATVSAVTRRMLNLCEKEKKVEYADSDIPRSFLLLSERKNKKNGKIKLSHISAAGLCQRTNVFLTAADEEA